MKILYVKQNISNSANVAYYLWFIHYIERRGDFKTEKSPLSKKKFHDGLAIRSFILWT